MVDIASVSQTELSQRRQQLRRQRRLRLLQSVWRSLAVAGLAGGLFWVATRPTWVIRQPEQVKVEGNRYISTQTIRALLPISYPQFLLKLQPQGIAEELVHKAPIETATVSRQLFPPGVTVQVKERYPVAVAVPAEPIAPSSTGAAAPSSSPNSSTSVGLLDKNGVWIPLESYTALKQTIKLPSLKVTGWRNQYLTAWSNLYGQVSQSPVKISEIDWRQPSNLILRTELGIVHFGSYSSSQFPLQLKALDQMRQLPERLSTSQITYIDLKDPDSPAIQVTKAKNVVKTNTP